MEVYYNDDYAGLHCKGIDAYYGYEVQDEEGNWCFEAKFKNKGKSEKIIISAQELGIGDQFDCVSNLIAGIGRVFEIITK